MNDSMAPVDPAQVWADDALLDEFTAHAPIPPPGLPQLELWRRNLDAAPLPALDMDQVVPRLPTARPACRRSVRRSTAALTALVVLAGGSVAAAAASGPTGPLGPLHRALFGTTHHTDPGTTQINALLNTAAHEIDVAAEAGGITPTGRQRIGALLATAEALLAVDHDAPSSLRRRHDELHRALTQLPALTQSMAVGQSTRAITDPPRPGPVAPQRGNLPTGAGPGAQPPARRPSTDLGGAARSPAVTPIVPRQPRPPAGHPVEPGSGSNSGTEEGPPSGGSADTTGSDGGPTAGPTLTSGSDSGSQDQSGAGSGDGTRSGRSAVGPASASASSDRPES